MPVLYVSCPRSVYFLHELDVSLNLRGSDISCKNPTSTRGPMSVGKWMNLPVTSINSMVFVHHWKMSPRLARFSDPVGRNVRTVDILKLKVTCVLPQLTDAFVRATYISPSSLCNAFFALMFVCFSVRNSLEGMAELIRARDAPGQANCKCGHCLASYRDNFHNGSLLQLNVRTFMGSFYEHVMFCTLLFWNFVNGVTKLDNYLYIGKI